MDLAKLATSPEWTLLFIALALVAWLLAAFGVGKWNVNWVAIGLICAALPFAYTAVKAI